MTDYAKNLADALRSAYETFKYIATSEEVPTGIRTLAGGAACKLGDANVAYGARPQVSGDLVERVAEGIWDAYMRSPMRKPDYEGLTWATIREGAKARPLIADVLQCR